MSDDDASSLGLLKKYVAIAALTPGAFFEQGGLVSTMTQPAAPCAMGPNGTAMKRGIYATIAVERSSSKAQLRDQLHPS